MSKQETEITEPNSLTDSSLSNQLANKNVSVECPSIHKASVLVQFIPFGRRFNWHPFLNLLRSVHGSPNSPQVESNETVHTRRYVSSKGSIAREEGVGVVVCGGLQWTSKT